MARRGANTFRVGGIGVLMAVAMMALPLVLPHSSVNRFLVAFGFIGLCWSLSLLLNGALDLLRQREKP